jgi:hypothetical protein
MPTPPNAEQARQAMTLEQAREILRTQDDSDIGKALQACAVVARFYGIAHPRLLEAATSLEQVAESLDASRTPQPGQEG